MTRQRRAQPAGQQVQPVVQPRRDDREAERRDARRGQFDRERQPVEPPADIGDQPHAGFVDRTIRRGRANPFQEQLDGGTTHDLVVARVVVGHHERSHAQHRFGRDMQRLAARHEYAQRAGARRQRFDEVRDEVDDVLGIVEHEQVARRRECGADVLDGGHALRVQAKLGRDGDQHVGARPRARQLHEQHALARAAAHRVGHAYGEARLADPARADERDDRRAFEHLDDLRDFGVASDERRRQRRRVGIGRYGSRDGGRRVGRGHRFRAWRRARDQQVAAPGHRLDQIAARAERLAQRRHMHLQAVFLDDQPGPDRVHDVVFRHDRPARAVQHFENVERACTDAQRRALTANVALLEIHRQRSDLDHGRLRVPQDDRPVNAAVHPAGCPAGAPWRRPDTVELRAECRRARDENLEGKCTVDGGRITRSAHSLACKSRARYSAGPLARRS